MHMITVKTDSAQLQFMRGGAYSFYCQEASFEEVGLNEVVLASPNSNVIKVSATHSYLYNTSVKCCALNGDFKDTYLMLVDSRQVELIDSVFDNTRITYNTPPYFTNCYLVKGEVRSKIVGMRKIERIGSRRDSLYATFTESGMFLSTGCKRNLSVDEFLAAVDLSHGSGRFYKEYIHALDFLQKVGGE